MVPALFAHAALRLLGRCPKPSRCPYCPAETRRHWIGWGRYERYAGDPEHRSEKVPVPRYRCKLKRRTFSMLPHALLPYWGLRTGVILEWLYALQVEAIPLSRLARRARVPRSTLRGLRAGFRRALPQLRLPERAAVLTAPAFLDALAALTPATIVPLFQAWKEREPKHCVVGIYSRSRRRPGPPAEST